MTSHNLFWPGGARLAVSFSLMFEAGGQPISGAGGVIGSDFVDHTLPPGRPQGPSGPAQASKGFLTAVPDLKVAVVQRLVVDCQGRRKRLPTSAVSAGTGKPVWQQPLAGTR